MPEETRNAHKAFGHIAPALAAITDDVLFGNVWKRPGLSPRDRSLVTVACLISLYQRMNCRSISSVQWRTAPRATRSSKSSRILPSTRAGRRRALQSASRARCLKKQNRNFEPTKEKNMQMRKLGQGLEVSALGLGCMGMTTAYGPASDKGE